MRCREPQPNLGNRAPAKCLDVSQFLPFERVLGRGGRQSNRRRSKGSLLVSNLTPALVEMNSIGALFALGFKNVTRQSRCAMVRKCANSWCPTSPHLRDGKLFRLDFDLGNMAGGNEQITEYIWLCAPCAQQMRPKVEVTGNTIRVLLSKIAPMAGTDSIASTPLRVN